MKQKIANASYQNARVFFFFISTKPLIKISTMYVPYHGTVEDALVEVYLAPKQYL
jgi:hypothetical protein